MKSNLHTILVTGGRKLWWATLFFGMTTVQLINAQNEQSISGTLNDQQNMEPIAFANVALYGKTDSVLVGGAMSNESGRFQIAPVQVGDYILRISVLGYETVTQNVSLVQNYNFSSGTILLQKKVFNLDEAVVTGERLKAKSELDKTVYFVNKKMCAASFSGTDILKYVPGIQVDIMNNVSLDGSKNILIFVDGKERDQNYLDRLNAGEIDKVEVTEHPGPNYEAGITGVIQVVLKKKKSNGFDGHFYADIPTSNSEIYSFPGFSLNYNREKIALYTSYNGEFSYFNIYDKTYRNFNHNNYFEEIVLNEYLRQKNWSHRFHFGFDFIPNKKSNFNFYGWYNPFSRELDGTTETKVTGNESSQTPGAKDDTDINHSFFYSLYFKHYFNQKGSEIRFDLSFYNLKAENITTFTSGEPDASFGNFSNSVKPNQNTWSLKIDYSTPLSNKLKLNAGTKTRLNSLKDRNPGGFAYDENNFALYSSLTFALAKTEMNFGVRVENSNFGSKETEKNKVLAVFPNVIVNHNFSHGNNLLLNYRRSLVWPNIYELNPYISKPDPFSALQGNAHLKPEFLDELSAGYSKRTTQNYFSGQLFYTGSKNSIGSFTRLNNSNLLETKIDNSGAIHDFGARFTGNFKLFESVSFNPYLRLFERLSQPNKSARLNGLHNRKQFVSQYGFSAIVTLKNNITASLIYQSGNSVSNFQGTEFSDALYFVSIEKGFGNNFKIGVSSAVPFSKTFTYQGSEVTGSGFYSRNTGNIKLSAIPLWLKVSYQFQSGNKANRIERKVETINNLPKKGF